VEIRIFVICLLVIYCATYRLWCDKIHNDGINP